MYRDVAHNLGLLHQQFETARRQLSETDYPPDMYQDQFRRLSAVFLIGNLASNWNLYAQYLTSELLLALRGAAHKLGMQEVAADADALKTLLADISSWEQEIVGMQLPPQLASYILEQFAAVRRRLLEYRLRGAAAIQEALAVYGAAMEALAP